MKLWEVIKEILRNKRTSDGYQEFLRVEYSRRYGESKRVYEDRLLHYYAVHMKESLRWYERWY